MTGVERTNERIRWEARKDDLATPLTGDEWARLRLELRDECTNHPKTNPLYALAAECEHDVPTEDYEDDLHKWSDDADALLCLARVVDHACICQDGYCSQEASALEARDDLWYAVSLAKRRAARAAHLADVVTDVWLSTSLTIEQVQDLAAECRTEDELRARVRVVEGSEQYLPATRTAS